jgi:hypothetical protein
MEVRPMHSHAELLDRVTFEGTGVDSLPYDTIREVLAAHTVVRIRGLFARDELRAVLAGITAGFSATRDERHDPRDSDAVRRNFQKLQVGANSGVSSRRTLGRFMRMLYNPIFADDIYGMRAHFITLARFRNLLYKLPVDFAVRGTDDGYWTCSRILQYPRGGGFIVPHRDMYAQVAAAEAGFGYYQPLLLLTEKGLDFSEGGAYVDVGDDRLFYEDGCRAGDVVVYDGRSMHGVSDIDPLEPLDLAHFSGRAVALATLFKLLVPGRDDYARMAEKARDWYGAGREKGDA